jgi:hypothetical protein
MQSLARERAALGQHLADQVVKVGAEAAAPSPPRRPFQGCPSIPSGARSVSAITSPMLSILL